jgi:hypothetical protein
VLVIEGVDVWHVEEVYDPDADPPWTRVGERSGNTDPHETATAEAP